jgi:hypothetical protein
MMLMNPTDASRLPAMVSVLEPLTEEELVQLNHVIVARLRLMRQVRAHGQMMNFHIGQAVRFDDGRGQLVRGMVKSHNRKSVTIVTDCGCQWRVSPHLLQAD